MATYTDNFNRANEDPLSGEWSTDLNAGLAIVSNQVKKGTGSSPAVSSLSSLTWQDDQTAEIELAVYANFDSAGPAVRLSGSGDGYAGFGENGRAYIIRLDSGSTTYLDTNYSVTTASSDVYRLEVTGTSLELFQNDVSVCTATDATHSSGAPGIYYNAGNVNGTLVDNFEATGQIVAASFAIDSTDASMQRSTDFQVVCSNPATAPTTGNSTLSNGGDTLTPSSVTGSGPYTLTFPVGDLTKQVDATGYDWTLTVDAETDTTGNIPLTIQSGWTKVDLVSPVTTNASLLFGVSGDTPVTGDDLEYDITSTLDAGVSFSVATDGVWTVTESSPGDWTTDITVDRRVVQANGTIGSTQEITLSAAEPSAPVMPADTSVNVAENSTTVGTFTASSGSPTPTYSLSGTDAALFSINSSTAAVTFDSAPDYESDPLSYSITVTATNSEGSDSQNITVNVTNVVETPVLASTLALTGTVDSAFSRTLSIQSGDAATSWTITGGADQGSYSINSSGVLSRTAPNDTEEDEVVTVTATNSAGTSNTQTVTITYSVSAGDGIVTDIVRDMVSNIVTDMVN